MILMDLNLLDSKSAIPTVHAIKLEKEAKRMKKRKGNIPGQIFVKHAFIVSCIVCTVLFVYFVYVYLFLFVLSVLV